MGARHVARNFQFQLEAPVASRGDLRVWLSVPPESTDKVNAMLILVRIVIEVTGAIVEQEKIVMKIDLQSGTAEGCDLIVKDRNQMHRDRRTQASREWRRRMFR
jgi:hypothetical protein